MNQIAADAPAVAQSKQRTGRARPLMRIVVALLIAWPIIAWVAARALIVRVELPRADAIVVLSGASSYVERTQHAAQLFRRGVAPKIILTNDAVRGGWSSEQQRNPFFIEREAEELTRAGVPIDKIEVLPEPVSSTYDEAALLRRYAETHNLGSILIVTSPYHSRRAWWTLQQVFRGSAVEVGLDPVVPGQPQQSPAAATWWLHLRGWRSVAVEYVKIVYYCLRYR